MHESWPDLLRGRHFQDEVILLCVRWYLRLLDMKGWFLDWARIILSNRRDRSHCGPLDSVQNGGREIKCLRRRVWN